MVILWVFGNKPQEKQYFWPNHDHTLNSTSSVILVERGILAKNGNGHQQSPES